MWGNAGRILTKNVAWSKVMTQQRATYLAGPPKYKISLKEKIALGTVMLIGVTGPSWWILANLRDYREGKF